MPGVPCLYIKVNVVVNRIEAMLYHRVPRLPNGSVPGSFSMVAVLLGLFRVVRPKRDAHFIGSKGYLLLPKVVTNLYYLFGFAAAHQTPNTAYRNKKGCQVKHSECPSILAASFRLGTPPT